MPRFDVAFETHADKTVVAVKFVGEADAGTIRRMIAELMSLTEREAPLRVLLDESELRAGLVLPADVKGIVDQWRATIAKRSVRIAVFASNPLVYGLNRMAEWLASRDAEGRLAVFTQRDDALAWLLRD